jgi:hypothetical protein
MCGKIFFLIFLVLELSLIPSAYAICFKSTLLASYEPDEINNLTVLTDPVRDPCLTATWVLGGINDVPEATEGDYVLKLKLEGETDHKV